MIGKHYYLKLDPKFFATAIPKSATRGSSAGRATVESASDLLIQKYKTYGKLENKEVKVLSSYSRRSSSTFKVALVYESDDYWFLIDKKYLVPMIKISNKCICTTKTLMCRGCQCGAFTFEKTQAEKEEVNEIYRNRRYLQSSNP